MRWQISGGNPIGVFEWVAHRLLGCERSKQNDGVLGPRGVVTSTYVVTVLNEMGESQKQVLSRG